MCKTLADELKDHIKAGFSGLYVHSVEPDEARYEIDALCKSQDGWFCHYWDIATGLDGNGNEDHPSYPGETITRLLQGKPDDTRVVLIMRHLNRFLADNIQLVNTVETVLHHGKGKDFTLIILSPVISLPIELQRLFTVLEHKLPDREQLLGKAKELCRDPESADNEERYLVPMPDGSDLDILLDSSQGLTRTEAENAFALSLLRHHKLNPKEVFNQKAQALKKTGFMRLSESKRKLDDLGGLQNIKSFCLKLLSPNHDRIGKPKGVLALGPPGTGKTAFAEALGNAVGLPTIILDIGALKGSLVGQSEERTRQAIATINAMGRCIVFIDEIEKAFAGSGGNGDLDSGVQAGIFGAFLTWLSDPDRQAFVIATSNDIRGIPSPLTRSGRFDAVFFWDLPGKEQKDSIWTLYIKRYKLDPSQDRPDDLNWSGADIEACCEKADLLGIPLIDASNYVVPVYKRSHKEIESLRDYCDGSTISADYPGLYRRNGEQKPIVNGKTVRKIERN